MSCPEVPCVKLNEASVTLDDSSDDPPSSPHSTPPEPEIVKSITFKKMLRTHMIL
jgi:hypothetical protein